ncbi:hypothetical protein AMECASPLE_009895 [Ameca splendens]|uniref:Uncharacterized protein n=1 Tax=Ameca splendens TaxID=208324 RepID=A0ABV0XDH0_9TELE
MKNQENKKQPKLGGWRVPQREGKKTKQNPKFGRTTQRSSCSVLEASGTDAGTLEAAAARSEKWELVLEGSLIQAIVVKGCLVQALVVKGNLTPVGPSETGER